MCGVDERRSPTRRKTGHPVAMTRGEPSDEALLSEGRLVDPYPLFASLRERDPVHWSDEADAWLVTRYSDCVAVFRDDEHVSSDKLTAVLAMLPDDTVTEFEPLRRHLGAWVVLHRPPVHTRLRRVVGRSFAPRAMDVLRGRIHAIVKELLGDLSKRREIDFVADFAYPLPAQVIAALLGVPAADRDHFKRWSVDIARFQEGVDDDLVDTARRAQESVLAMNELVERLVAARSRQPQDDLISVMVQARSAGLMSDDELYGMCSFLLTAGHETTTALLGNGLRAMLASDSTWPSDDERSASVAAAVEELLRFDSPLQRITRVATTDFELAGRSIRKGDRLWMMLGSANRDEKQFPEPDRIRLDRIENRHIAFGSGIHACLGAPLARLEARIAFTQLFGQVGRMELRGGAEMFRGVSLRQPSSLPLSIEM